MPVSESYSENEITLTSEELETLHGKLIAFAAGLDKKEADVLSLLITRASTAKEKNKKEITKQFLAEKRREIETPSISLPLVASAIDGVSDASDPGWLYTVWSYHF
jgi:hypothetical protein